MRGSRLFAAIMLLSLIFVCFISAPVFSVEDPWDVDGDGSGSGGEGDNPDTITPGDGDSLLTITGGEESNWPSDWFMDWMGCISYQVIRRIASYYSAPSGSTEDKAESSAGQSVGR